MPKPKSAEREQSIDKVKLILAGAMQEFLVHGYAGARIDKIVEAAGVSKATVYRYFPDKEALFTALIQQMATAKKLFRLQNPQSYEEDPDVFLRRYATEMLDKVTEDPQVLTLLRIIVGESGRFPELARAYVKSIVQASLDFLTHYFANHPKLKIADPEVAARTFMGTLVHFVLLRDVLNSGDLVPMDRDRLLDGLIALILDNHKVE